MILKLHTGWEKWKYLEDVTETEVELVTEYALAFRLGYTLDRIKTFDIGIKEGTNTLELMEYYPPIDNTGLYTGQVQAILYKLTYDEGYTPQFQSVDAPGVKETTNGNLMAAITCFRNGVKHHIFTNCECYLLNDLGKTINRLL